MRKNRKFIVLIAALGMLALAAGGLWRTLDRLGRGRETHLSLLAAMASPRDRFPNKDRVNILVIGKDYDRDSKGMPYTKHSRADTLIMLSLDLKNKRASALSIPRDTYVVAADGRRGKINSAYRRGGAPLVRRTVGNLLGVQPDYHIALKPDAVKTIVDELGGVEVTTLDRMKYDDNWGQLHIDLPAGKQTINGEQAVGFTRFRKSNPGQPRSKEEGDERRMARQQQLLKAMTQKARARFKNPLHLFQADDLADTMLNSIETDLAPGQLFALASLFRRLQPSEMQMASVPGTDYRRGGEWYFRPDRSRMALLVEHLLKDNRSASSR